MAEECIPGDKGASPLESTICPDEVLCVNLLALVRIEDSQAEVETIKIPHRAMADCAVVDKKCRSPKTSP